jgi:hypothetical protein
MRGFCPVFGSVFRKSAFWADEECGRFTDATDFEMPNAIMPVEGTQQRTDIASRNLRTLWNFQTAPVAGIFSFQPDSMTSGKNGSEKLAI